MAGDGAIGLDADGRRIIRIARSFVPRHPAERGVDAAPVGSADRVAGADNARIGAVSVPPHRVGTDGEAV